MGMFLCALLPSRYHGLYKEALLKLFQENKEKYVPGEDDLRCGF